MMTNTEERIRAMDQQGIDVEALSINPCVVDIKALRALAPLPRAPVPRPSRPQPRTPPPAEPQAQQRVEGESSNSLTRARALWHTLTCFFTIKTDPLPTFPPLPQIPAGFTPSTRDPLVKRIERYRLGITRQRSLGHGKQGDLYSLQATLAKLEDELTTFDRVREDKTLAALKAAVAEIEARRATAK